MNKYFYAIKLDAETKDSIHFMGNTYFWSSDGGTNGSNQFAVKILNGQMSFPTGVYMEENFQNPQLIPGYQDVPSMEMILKYLGDNIYKKKPFEDYRHDFKASWM